ncbi:MAG: membrane dipeptidase [Chloroflexi bacterium]|nr:membrane dipeptidase [Chloroflexota bacterium]
MRPPAPQERPHRRKGARNAGRTWRWPPFIEELDRPEKMHIIAERLEQRGFSGAEVAQVMGGNFLRVYEEILG